MQWNVPGPNAKVLAQAFQCLSKIGDEVYIEGREEALTFRTVNAAKTAYAAFKFAPDFFSYYPNVIQGGVSCQVSMKAILIAFRFPAHIEKLVESCGVILKSNENDAYEEKAVEILFRYKPGLIKRVHLHLIDAELIQDSYNPDAFPSDISLHARILAEHLISFHACELTMVFTQTSLHFRNFNENCDDDLGIRTDMLVSQEDLLTFNVAQNAELTFTLAELRTILSFAEHLGVPIGIHFDEPGKPVCFVLKNDILLLEVVLSTIGGPTSEKIPPSELSSSYASNITTDISQNEDGTIVSQPCSQPGLLNRILVRPEPVYLGDILAADSGSDYEVDE